MRCIRRRTKARRATRARAASPGARRSSPAATPAWGAAAIAFAREGADVAINYFPTEEPDAGDVIKLISDARRKGIPLPGDLREEAFCTKLVADAIAALSGLDMLVCNAGRQQAHDSNLDVSSEDFEPR